MIRVVLCPVDFSPTSHRELRLASQLCERFRAKLVALHCLSGEVPPLLGVSWMHAEEHRTEEPAKVAEARERIKDLLAEFAPRVEAEGAVTRGPLDRTLLGSAAALPADLIVIGTHGRTSLQHRSLADRVIVGAPCPVLTTRDETPDESFAKLPSGGFDTIRTLVPVDFSPHSSRALDYAFRLLRWLPLELRVLHVDSSSSADEGETLERLRAQVPLELRDRVTVEVHRGDPAHEILFEKVNVQARLIVMGTHHQALVKRLLGGSTAREVLHVSFCPVWFVPEASRIRSAPA